MRKEMSFWLLVILLMSCLMSLGYVTAANASEMTLVRSDGSVIKTTDTPREVPQFDRVVEIKDPTAYYTCMDEAARHHIRYRRYELMERCNNIVMGAAA